MDKRYQVFVSSTYVDLVEERDQVIKAILDMGHIPVGMEMFSAADEEQWETIKREIDRSDYYLLIVAHRYGSTIKAEGGIGYTEKEFDYAVAQQVPRIGFVIKEGVPWKPEYVDGGPLKRRLDAFKTKVRGKPVDFWTDAPDLGLKVAISLPKLIARSPRPGWERSREDSARTLAAMTHLSEENAILRAELERLQALVSDKVPALDCLFLDEEGTAVGRRMTVAAPSRQPAGEYARRRVPEINDLVTRLDEECRARTWAVKATREAFGLDSLGFAAGGLFRRYTVDRARISRVMRFLNLIKATKPTEEWAFDDLFHQPVLAVPGYSQTSKPTSGTDLAKYTVFTELEGLAREVTEELLRLGYASTHRRVQLQLANVSRIPAEDLTVRVEFKDDIAIGLFDLDDRKRPETSVETRYATEVSLISPQDTVTLPVFVVGLPDEGRQIDFTVRVTGRNLPEVQAIPMTILATQPGEPVPQAD